METTRTTYFFSGDKTFKSTLSVGWTRKEHYWIVCFVFFRQLILDGQWDDILEFIQPLSTLTNFDNNLFNFHVLKAKLIELVCIKSEDSDETTDQVWSQSISF